MELRCDFSCQKLFHAGIIAKPCSKHFSLRIALFRVRTERLQKLLSLQFVFGGRGLLRGLHTFSDSRNCSADTRSFLAGWAKHWFFVHASLFGLRFTGLDFAAFSPMRSTSATVRTLGS